MTTSSSLRKCTVFLTSALLCWGCKPSEPEQFILHQGEVKRVEGCHLLMSAGPGKDTVPFAAMRFVCDVPESALKQEQWWGDKPQPLSFAAAVGDCLLLGERFYCIDKVKLGEATFKATYKWATKQHDHLEMIR